MKVAVLGLDVKGVGFMKRFVLLLALFASFALAQEDVVISPQSIIVNPLPSFDVEVFVDKDPSGATIPTYEIGEAIRIGVRVSEDAYVYLFNVRSNGDIQQILPNRLDDTGRRNFVEAGTTRYFPRQDARYTFNIAGPRGLDKVIAVASKEPLNTSQLTRFDEESDFATSAAGEDSFAQALSIVVQPLPQEGWVTDTALFYVGQDAPRSQFGTISVTSDPRGAAAYIDGQFVGYTPVRFGTRAGEHTVRLELEGYEPFQTTVNLGRSESLDVSASLSAVRRTGTVTFQSQPRGADVYVDGRLVGSTPTGALTFDEGSYQARFNVSGYEDFVANFSVNRNSDQTVTADLRPLTGSLQVRANVGGARVFVNGEQVGTIPSGSGRLTIDDLPAGQHELTVVAPGFTTVLRDFSVRGGETTTINVSQTRL